MKTDLQYYACENYPLMENCMEKGLFRLLYVFGGSSKSSGNIPSGNIY